MLSSLRSQFTQAPVSTCDERTFFIGESHQNPKIGDAKVKLFVANPLVCSLIAKQVSDYFCHFLFLSCQKKTPYCDRSLQENGSLVDWRAPSTGNNVAYFQMGSTSLTTMLDNVASYVQAFFFLDCGFLNYTLCFLSLCCSGAIP
jgi:hypothetical protein